MVKEEQDDVDDDDDESGTIHKEMDQIHYSHMFRTLSSLWIIISTSRCPYSEASSFPLL